MRWQPALIDRLAKVRDLRMRLAEMELVRADAAVKDAQAAELEAQQALKSATSQRSDDIAQADQALLVGRTGGRRGIQDWQEARKQAEVAVHQAQARAGDSASQRLEAELASSTARATWRGMRVNAERLRLLTEQFQDPSS